MKKRLYFISIGLIIVAFLTACQPQQTQTAPTATITASNSTAVQPINTDAPVSVVVLKVTGPKGEKEYTMDALKALPVAEGQAGLKSSTGKITIPVVCKGVLLTDLLKEVGGDDPSLGVQLTAADGYAMTYSYDQIAKGTFVTYDPATGDEVKDAGPLQVIIAYEADGKPLDAETDGTLRLMVISQKPNQVVDGHWTTRFVTNIDVKSLVEEWSLELDGAINTKVDRGSYESCSTEKCHQAAWQDTKSQKWVGVPLYLILGEVDDNIKHDTGAYNKAMAEAGYSIDLIALDGFIVTLDSKQVDGNKNIIVASTMNGNVLTDKNFPLKLVGPDLTNKQMIGGIAKIVLHINPSAATTEAATVEATTVATTEAAITSAPASTTLFELTGLVTTPQKWTHDDLKKLTVVKESVEHPKKGKMDVQGIKLADLLKLAGVKTDAKSITITASDGYSVDADLQEVNSCAKCMVAFMDDGTLMTIMPDLASNTWVKNLAKIEIK
jgi:DMSO/TMAO reductase YedYZ molybdopterin-dependent catalytic subunit